MSNIFDITTCISNSSQHWYSYVCSSSVLQPPTRTGSGGEIGCYLGSENFRDLALQEQGLHIFGNQTWLAGKIELHGVSWNFEHVSRGKTWKHFCKWGIVHSHVWFPDMRRMLLLNAPFFCEEFRCFVCPKRVFIRADFYWEKSIFQALGVPDREGFRQLPPCVEKSKRMQKMCFLSLLRKKEYLASLNSLASPKISTISRPTVLRGNL